MNRLTNWYQNGTVRSMDISIKNLEPEIVQRLAAQAEIEGMSAQEWMRQVLRRAASLLTPTELNEKVATRTGSFVSDERYREIMADMSRRWRGGPTGAGA